MTHKGKEKPRS